MAPKRGQNYVDGKETQMTIKQFDKSLARLTSEQLVNELSAFARSRGINIAMKGGRFTEQCLTVKLELATTSKGVVHTAIAEAFKRHAPLFGLKKSDLGRSFKHAGDSYTIIGLKPRASRFPVVVESTNGKRFKMPVSYVQQGLGRKVTY
jgi:hypothetical protein